MNKKHSSKKSEPDQLILVFIYIKKLRMNDDEKNYEILLTYKKKVCNIIRVAVSCSDNKKLTTREITKKLLTKQVLVS